MKTVRLVGLVALVAGMTAPATALAQDSYTADLSGDAEVPGPGDSDGSGLATLDWNDLEEKFCYAISVESIGTATAAHVHRGAAGEAGPPVLTLDPPSSGESDGCVDAPTGLRGEIRRNPADYYFNIHNADHPAGAVRGQLEN